MRTMRTCHRHSHTQHSVSWMSGVKECTADCCFTCSLGITANCTAGCQHLCRDLKPRQLRSRCKGRAPAQPVQLLCRGQGAGSHMQPALLLCPHLQAMLPMVVHRQALCCTLACSTQNRAAHHITTAALQGQGLACEPSTTCMCATSCLTSRVGLLGSLHTPVPASAPDWRDSQTSVQSVL